MLIIQSILEQQGSAEETGCQVKSQDTSFLGRK